MPQNLSDGDAGFTGVNTRLDPGQLQAGNVASAINMRFERGVAAPRFGIRKMASTEVMITLSAAPSSSSPVKYPATPANAPITAVHTVLDFNILLVSFLIQQLFNLQNYVDQTGE